MVQGVKIEAGHIVDVNPATGEEVGRVKCSTEQEVDAAIAAAQKVQPSWAGIGLAERTELVKAAVRRIGDVAGLAELITKEMGKTLKESEEEVVDNADKDEYCELVMRANEPETHGSSVIVRHPHGVVSICAPWNYPVEEIVLLSIPALIAGNAVVVKPSEVVPLSGAAVVGALAAGLNGAWPGLVNLVQGDGAIGSYLVAHPSIDMCAFTGSTATGKKILEGASKSLKRVVLECGGKDPMVVMADADVDVAAKDAVDFSLANCGQVCCAVERVYVADEIYPAFEAKVVEHAKSYVFGNGLDPASQMGPLVSDTQRQIVHQHVQAATKAGAKCLVGGKLPPSADKGTFYPPTVLSGVPHAAKAITQEETFGPVVALSRFDGSDETAVQLANDSTYGLTASVYSGDIVRAGKIAARISAGQVGINNNPLSGARDVRSPFVGHKRSGYGSHSGTDGWRQFSTPKTLIYTAPPDAQSLPTPAQALPTVGGGAKEYLWPAVAAAAIAVAVVAVMKK